MRDGDDDGDDDGDEDDGRNGRGDTVPGPGVAGCATATCRIIEVMRAVEMERCGPGASTHESRS